MSLLWKHFKICMCCSYDNCEINLTQWHIVPHFHFHSLAISVKSKVLFSAVLELHMTDGWYLHKMVPICFHLHYHLCAHICFSMDSNKNHLTEISWFLGRKAWQHKLDQEYCREKLVSRFSNDFAKLCSYRLKLTMKIKMKHLIHSKAYFHIFSIFRTGCLSTFKNHIRLHSH